MSTSTVQTPEEFKNSFPHPTLAKIEGRPDNATLTANRNQIKDNAASIPSDLGGGQHGLLGSVLPHAMYATIAVGQQFVPPAFPGTSPVIPPNVTEFQYREILRLHNENLVKWRNYTNAQQAMKQLIIDSIEPVYLRAIRDRHAGFANVSIIQIYEYLFNTYGKLSPQELMQNQTAIHKAWDPTTPFEVLVDQIEDCQEIAATAGQPFTEAQILTAAYTNVFNTGLYFEDCKAWNKRPVVKKTWANFKAHFQQAQAELNEVQATGHGHQNFAGAVTIDQLQHIVDSINTPPPAPGSDPGYLALAATNADLAAQLLKAQQDIAELQQKMTAPRNTGRGPRRPRELSGSYCWSHGFFVAADHNSANCHKPKPGHKTEATKENRMGGSEAGMSRE